jgi:hypothetical protein
MRLATRFRVRGDRTRVTRLLATRLAAGSAIRVSCRGRGCSFAARTIHAQDDRADLARPFGPRALRPGARIRLRVTAPGHTSRTVTITVRRGRAPLIVR